jgi:zinc-ribbon domain
MATFCASCGSVLADGTRFCEKCGAAVAGPPGVGVPAGTPTPGRPGPAPGAPQASSTAVKIIIAILAVIMFFVLLVAGGCFYFAYRVRQKTHEFTKNMENVTPYAGKREPCAMLSASEASDALGQPVSSAEPTGSTACRYTYDSDPSRGFRVTYNWQGGAMAMGITHGVMKNLPGGASFTPLDGVGDEAYLGPAGSTLMMRKGDVMVNIDLRNGGVSADAAKKMARTIAEHL